MREATLGVAATLQLALHPALDASAQLSEPPVDQGPSPVESHGSGTNSLRSSGSAEARAGRRLAEPSAQERALSERVRQLLREERRRDAARGPAMAPTPLLSCAAGFRSGMALKPWYGGRA